MKRFYEELIKKLQSVEHGDQNLKSAESHCLETVKRYNISEMFGIDVMDWSGSAYGGYLTKGYGGCHADEHIVCFTEKRSIGCPDDDKQPEKNEWFYELSFSTGAYIFGDHYPKGLFSKFFNELKSYNPKHIDSMNSCLYFGADNANVIAEKYSEIKKKYLEEVSRDKKRMELEEIKDRARKLEEELISD